MRIDPFGDNALIVTFDRVISEAVNRQVIALYNSLKSIDKFNFLIPAYHSLTVGLKPQLITFEQAAKLIQQAHDEISFTEKAKVSGKTYVIPVCYEPPYALDLNDVAQQTGLSTAEIISTHTRHTYRVYMLGFVAGFAYMGSLPETLNCQRKETPRTKAPQGSVGLAGLQTGIYPTEAPGGWQIIGRTPLEMFNAESSPTSLLQAGDLVRFRPIGIAEFKILRLEIETGVFEMEVTDV